MTDPPDADPPGPEWSRTESTSEAVFDLGPVKVTAATILFEDRDLRASVAERTGIDRPWRFAFASRVDVPGSSGSRALRRLVTDLGTGLQTVLGGGGSRRLSGRVSGRSGRW